MEIFFGISSASYFF